MNFGEAIEALKEGKFVTRKGWNGKGMYLWYMPPAMIKAEWCKEPHLKALAEANGGEVECLGSIRMKTADNKVLTGWLASQTDMMSEDWMIADVNKNSDVDSWNYRGIRFFRGDMGVRYWGSGEVDGAEDDEDNPTIPCVSEKYGEKRWDITIDIKDGRVINWPKGTSASVYYKVVDDGYYIAYDRNMNVIKEIDGYVPEIMAFDDEGYGYGDYVSLTINDDGYVVDWPKGKSLEHFMDSFLDGEDE
jgi:hypothetical protein